jgi:hypothetical protein
MPANWSFFAAPQLGTPVAPLQSSWQTSDAAERIEHGGYTEAELDALADDVDGWARMHGFTPERVSKEPVSLVPSPLQHRMFGYYRYCQRLDAPCRMIVVKIRRGGGSTGAEWIMHVHATNHVAKLGTIGTDETVSMNMFEMAKFFDLHDSFPGYRRAVKILETGEIKWPNGTEWTKYTAQKPEAARSAGLQGYHATEVGRWPNGGVMDAKETLKSMLGAVPRRGFTVVVEESTARGASGAFYNRFMSGRWPTAEELNVAEGDEYWRQWEDETPQNQAASETERRLQFVRVFSAWFEDDENRPEMPVSSHEADAIAASLDEKEAELVRRYQTMGPQGQRLGGLVTKATVWDQLAWRRSVIATEFEGDVSAFEQENPSSPKEAFASSGKHTFNRAGCAWMVDTAKGRIPEYGVLERQPTGGVIFRRTELAQAWCYLWDSPKEGCRYIAALDTCGGKSNQRDPNYCDYNAGLVLRAAYVDADSGQKYPHRVVASLLPKCQFDPDILAEKMGLMSEFFGKCLLVFEVNNTGAAFRQDAKRLGLNLYREEVTDKHTSEVTEYVGWTTTKETRPQLIGELKRHIRNNAARRREAKGWSAGASSQRRSAAT